MQARVPTSWDSRDAEAKGILRPVGYASNTGYFFWIPASAKAVRGEKTMLKEKRKILKECSYYRGAENQSTGRVGYCNLDKQTECTGETRFCENPEVLNKYALERGLGWHKEKGSRFKRVLKVISRLTNACWR